jgi:hypothetical protein
MALQTNNCLGKTNKPQEKLINKPWSRSVLQNQIVYLGKAYSPALDSRQSDHDVCCCTCLPAMRMRVLFVCPTCAWNVRR